MNKKFKNRVVIITGAGSQKGIGKATALAFAEEGAHVVVGDINFEGVKEVEKIIKNMGGSCLASRLDVTNENEVTHLVNQTIKKFKHIDVLVNNAGIAQSIIGNMMKVTLEGWEKVMNVNLIGTFLCTKAVLPYMIKNKYGRIINMSSISAKGGGLFGGVHYAAAKAGILGFTRALAREIAMHGITVNAICPGAIETDFRQDKETPEFKAEIVKPILIHRYGKPEEVAATILFLSSPESSYIIGEAININGGAYMD